MATTTPRKPAPNAKTRASMRERLSAVMEATVVEDTLDRVLVKRLRPLRDELKAARLAAAEQTDLRVAAEVRAARAHDEAEALRVQLAEVSNVLEAAQERPAPWWRRRRALDEQPA